MVLDREDRLLDAAIDVLGTRGMRQLTHRAVDAAAGLPVGSTSNRFRTRESLLVGVLRRILERETAIWTRLAVDIRTPTVEAVAGAIGRLLEELTDAGRVLSQARRTDLRRSDQPAHPARPRSLHLQDEIGVWMVPLLSELGSSDPSRDVHHLLALMDGLVINQLTSPRSDFDPTRAVTALLNGLTADNGASEAIPVGPTQGVIMDDPRTPPLGLICRLLQGSERGAELAGRSVRVRALDGHLGPNDELLHLEMRVGDGLVMVGSEWSPSIRARNRSAV